MRYRLETVLCMDFRPQVEIPPTRSRHIVAG